MRIQSFFRLLAMGVMAGGLCLAGSRSETVTYIEGNLAGVTPNTGGTMSFRNDKTFEIRAGLAMVPVSYSAVSKAELGATREYSHDAPLYKVWSFHKRFTGRTVTRLLMVNFKDQKGEDKTMTLELARNSAEDVLSTIQTRSGHAPAKATPTTNTTTAAAPPKAEQKKAEEEWWGDRLWKTTRNAEKWRQPGN